MKVRDFMRQIRETDLADFEYTLEGSRPIQKLDPADIEQAPGTIYVKDEQGCLVGKVERETLLFLIRRQRNVDTVQILDEMHDAVIAVDAAGRIFYANAAYTTILGVPLRRIMGRFIQDIEPGSLLNRALLERQPQFSEKQLVPSVSKYVSLNAFPLWDGEDAFAGAVSLFRDITQIHRLSKEVRHMSGVVDEYTHRLQSQEAVGGLGIVTRDRAFQMIIQQAAVVAKTDVPLLIRGENGTGKDVLAHYLHQCSNRKDKPLIIVNCAAIPESLMESELFGYEGGAFTGADREGRKGKFELADGGTLFLDEIGDMPLLMQSKLLRVIQQGEIEKIGRQRNVPVNVRVIAATNQPLEEMIREKRFRQDLFFRLNTITLTIPPLRERTDDIVPLTNYFLDEYNRKYQKQVRFAPDTYQQLNSYTWPGNVRELKSYVERAVILSDGSSPPAVPKMTEPKSGTPAEAGPSVQVPAGSLELSRRTFYRKCAELGVGAKK